MPATAHLDRLYLLGSCLRPRRTAHTCIQETSSRSKTSLTPTSSQNLSSSPTTVFVVSNFRPTFDMTAVPRDPAFWRRFSTAVHLDESSHPTNGTATPILKPLCASTSTASSTNHADPEKQAVNWLEHERAKQRRNRIMYPLFFISTVALIALVILILVWLSSHGWFMHGEQVTFP